MTQALHGRIEVICGCMFSGKTEELIRLIRRVQYAKQPFQVFKPSRDNRDATDAVVTHLKNQIPCTPVPRASDILEQLEEGVRVVGIDEVQFFDDEIVNVCHTLAQRGLRVIVAGLDRDSRNRTFGAMGELLAKAEMVTKLSAVCTTCGMAAHYTQALFSDADQHLDESGNVVIVGAEEIFCARCREHFTPA